MKKIALIQSHCNTEEKQNILKHNIDVLENLGVDILLFSHIPLPETITSKVKYYIFDSTNPILWDDRKHHYWWANNDYRLESLVPDYSWTVYNQIIKSYNLLQSENYEMYFIVCYDLIIDNFVKDIIINNKVGKYRHVKPKHVNEVGEYTDVIFPTSLIFLSLYKEQLKTITTDLNKSEYITHPEWTAENYLEIILQRNNLNIKNLGDVKDMLHESTTIFNDSLNEKYEIFVDTTDLITFRYIKKDLDCEHYVIINDEIIKIPKEIFIHSLPVNNLINFGVFINKQYDDLMFILNKNKINKIIKL